MKRFLASFFLLFALTASAQTPHPPINSPVFRAFDANGAPLAGGMLYTYAAGSSTPLATYSDAGAITPNTNPVVLDSTGSAKIFLAAANYKFVLQDANGVQQWTVDNISGAPPASDVTSVFGRTGVVVAVTGDYSCGQISGAVCSIPTIYYQTVNAGGTDLPQESTLKLIDGANIATSCVDNTGGHSTDCTIANTATALPAAVCNTSACYRQWPDGSIDEWGTLQGCSTSDSTCSTAITFPHAFNSTTFLAVTANCLNPGTDHNCSIAIESESTTGFNARQAPFSIIGGSGSNLSGSQLISWSAHGN